MASIFSRALDKVFPSRVQRRNLEREHLAAVKKYIDEGKLPMPEVRKELGISGTANWFGSPQVEENPELQREEAYGFPGSVEWGRWERAQRTDPAVAMSLEFVTAQLRDAQVDVTPAPKELVPELWRVSQRIGEKTVTLAEAQAEFVKEQLTQRISWAEFMQQTVRGAIGSGFALHEPVFTNVRSANLIGPAGGTGFGLKKLAERLPSSVHPNGWLEKDGELESIKQHGQLPDGSWGQVVLPADAILLNSWNRSGNNYLGFSQFRPVYYLVKARIEIIKTAAISVIREGAGIPIAYTDDPDTDLSKGQQRKLRKLLSNTVVHEHASVVMPPGWKAEWLFSPAANKGHVVDVYNAMGLIILQMVFGQQLVLGTGAGGAAGNRAVGEVHDLRADTFVQGFAGHTEGILNGVSERPYTGLTKKLIDPNYGPQAAYPRIGVTLKKARMDPAAKAQAVKTSVDAGAITITHDVEVTLREDLGLETISKEEWEAGQEQKRAAAEALLQAKKEAGGEDDPDGDNKPEKKPTSVPRGTKVPSGEKPPRKFEGGFTPWRELRGTERFTEFAAIDSFLKRARLDFERRVRPIVGEMLIAVLPEVRAAMGNLKDGLVDHAAIASLPLDASRMESFIADFIARARAEGYRQLKGERGRGRKAKRDTLAVMPVEFAEEGDDRDREASPEAEERHERNDELLVAKRKALVRKMQNRLRQRLEDEAINVERTGGEPDDVVREVLDEQFDTGAFRTDAGGVLMTAFNLGRDDFMATYGDDVEGVELSAILDENTCEHCEELDGEEFDFGSAGYEENTPPLRGCEGRNQCRCLYVVQWK